MENHHLEKRQEFVESGEIHERDYVLQLKCSGMPSAILFKDTRGNSRHTKFRNYEILMTSKAAPYVTDQRDSRLGFHCCSKEFNKICSVLIIGNRGAQGVKIAQTFRTSVRFIIEYS